MKEREYNKLKAQIEAEYRKNLNALDLVYKMAGEASGGSSATAFSNGNLASEVRKSVEKQQGIFTVREVDAGIILVNPDLKGHTNRTSISGVLRRLEKDQHIVVIERGSGKRATRYTRLVSDESPPMTVRTGQEINP